MTPDQLAAILARNEAEDWGDPQQINTDVADLLYHVETLATQVAAVRELHTPYTAGDSKQYCEICVEAFPWGGESIDYPCPTIRALDGD